MTGGFSTFPSGAFDSGCYDHPHYLFDRRNFAFDLYDLADYIDRRAGTADETAEKNPFPVHELSMMMTIALRFIPTLIEETDKIMNAQKARGADLESGGIMQRAKSAGADFDSFVRFRLPPGGRAGAGHGVPLLSGGM